MISRLVLRRKAYLFQILNNFALGTSINHYSVDLCNNCNRINFTLNTHNFVGGLGWDSVTELNDLLGGRQELAAPGPRAACLVVLAEFRGALLLDLVLVGAAPEVGLRHEQHPADQVSRRDAGRPGDFPGRRGEDINFKVLLCPQLVI